MVSRRVIALRAAFATLTHPQNDTQLTRPIDWNASLNASLRFDSQSENHRGPSPTPSEVDQVCLGNRNPIFNNWGVFWGQLTQLNQKWSMKKEINNPPPFQILIISDQDDEENDTGPSFTPGTDFLAVSTVYSVLDSLRCVTNTMINGNQALVTILCVSPCCYHDIWIVN